MGQADFGVTCPMSMTYAVVPALRVEPAVAAVWAPRVTREAYDPRFAPASQKRAATMGMAMTEKQGGSDVRANTTRAVASRRRLVCADRPQMVLLGPDVGRVPDAGLCAGRADLFPAHVGATTASATRSRSSG